MSTKKTGTEKKGETQYIVTESSLKQILKMFGETRVIPTYFKLKEMFPYQYQAEEFTKQFNTNIDRLAAEDAKQLIRLIEKHNEKVEENKQS